MVITSPGSPWQFSRNGTSASATGTICWDAATVNLGYLVNAVITYDASAVGKIWLWQGTTATILLGPFYPVTCDSWIMNFGPRGLACTTTGLDIGWCCSTSGIVNVYLNGYAV